MRGRIIVRVLAGLGFVVGAALVPLIAESRIAPDRGLWIALTLVIGWGFVGAGAYAWLRRPDNRTGALMMATGFAWYLAVANLTEPPLLFTIGALSDHLFTGAAIHLVLAFPSGRLRGALDRTLVALGYLAVTVGLWVPVMFLDPVAFGCLECPRNLVLLESQPEFVANWYDGLSVVGIAIVLAVLAAIFVHWRDASEPLRRVVTPVFAAGSALMVLLAVLLFALLVSDDGQVWTPLYYATLAPFGSVPYIFLAGLVRARALRGGAVGSLVATLGTEPSSPGALRDALAEALGDPSVDLAYWLPELEQHVDVRGRRVELCPPPPGRAVHDVTLNGQRVAAIVHDASLLDDPGLVRAVAATAALALERERLNAELRAKVDELRESRTRMVRFGMAERRRLERDLHDGAQQRLVSLALDLRLAAEKVRSDPGASEQLLAEATDELSQALEELRELARGIHPALLSDRGLIPAIEALARRSPVPVEVRSEVDGDVPEAAELTTYFVVSEALANVAKYARATRIELAIRRRSKGSRHELIVEIADDGVGGADPSRGSGLRGLADRVATLNGSVEIESAPGAGTTVRATIPDV